MSGLRVDVEAMLGAGEMSASIATVDENGVDVDGNQVMLKVTLHPTGEPRTVRLGFDYVGPEFGVYTLPLDGDELLVVFPRDGGPGVAVKRLNNDIDKIPDDLRDLKGKRPILLVHASGWKFMGTDDEIRLVAGDTPVIVEGSDIKLGDESAVQLCQKAVADKLNDFITAFNSHTQIGAFGIPTTPPITPETPLVDGLTTKTRAS